MDSSLDGEPVWEIGTSMGSAFSSPSLYDDFYELPTP